MSLKTLKYSSYIYLILPVIFFLIGWIKPIIAIPFSIAIIYAMFIVNKNCENTEMVITEKKLAIVFVILLIICVLAGQGGLFYQSHDHHWRNAIFRDLINQEWPVYYERSDTYLDYYIGHWLVPAGIAKMFLPISQSFAWFFGNIMLLFWSAIGITLAFLWIINGIKNKNKKNLIIALLIFIFFSGLDIIGIIKTKNIIDMHLEWWATSYQFSSMMTQLFWVFNQSIPTWLIIMMFLKEKNVENYFLLIILLLPYAPLPFLGAIPLFACNGFRCLYKSIKDKKVKQFFKEAFSIQNIIALVCILPIFYFYYSLNQSTVNSGFAIYTQLLTPAGILNLLMFWFLEIGIYGIFLYKEYRKSPLFWTSIITLLFIPICAFGGARDLAMRGSIPALIVGMVFVIDFLVNKFDETKKLCAGAIIVCLMIGAVTPGYEFTRAITTVIKNKHTSVADGLVTFSNKIPDYFTNFLAENTEDAIFIKYLMKK